MSLAHGRQQIFWVGDTLWNVCGQSRERLFDAWGLRLEQWRQQGLATLIKSGAGRTIWRVRLPDLDLYVKHFWTTTPLNLIHQLVRRGRAEKEFHLSHLLHECGVATIKPIALGERRKHGFLTESYLLTEAIPGGMTLFEFIDRCVLTGRTEGTPKLRFHFADELAKLAARIHETGIEHRDLHEKNIVIQPADAGFRFYLLDLHELEIHRPLSWARARRELSRMGRYFTLRTSAADRFRFFQKYAELRGFSRAETRRLAVDLEAATIESRADFWRRRDSRKHRDSTLVREYRLPGAHAYAVQEIPEATVHELMRDPESPFHPERGSVQRWWKIGRSSRVAEIDLPAIRRGDSLIYKQYCFKGWHESLAAVVRQNQAMRAWNNGASLLRRELPTPLPLMLIQKLTFGLPVTSFLVTERVPDALTIDYYLNRFLSSLPGAERRAGVRAVIVEAARLLRKMHDRRVTHRDLKATNILVSNDGNVQAPKLWLIDLDGVQTWQKVPERCRLQNLTRFYVNFHVWSVLSLIDRIRLLRI